MRVSRLAGALGLVGVLAISGCSGSDDAAAPTVSVAVGDDATTSSSSTTTSTTTTTTSTTTSTTSSTTTTTTTEAPMSDEEQILDVIERYWWTVGNAFDPPQPDPEIWVDVATLENTVNRLERIQFRLDNGQGIRNVEPDGPYVLSAVVTEINGVTATAWHCNIDDAYLYDLETGDEIDAVAAIVTYETTLQFVDGRWLVDTTDSGQYFEPGEAGECEASLPGAS